MGTASTIPNDLATAPRYNPEPGPDIGPSGGDEPTPTADITEAPTASTLLAPVTPDQEKRKSDDGIPVDDGQSTYVAIQGPLSGRSYSSPLTIAGVARVFEARVTIDVSQNGKVLKQTHAMASRGAPELGDWQVTIALDPGAYRIDAYALSEKDGTTRLASDSIWITIQAPEGATAPTPSPSPTSGPAASASPTPASTAPPRSDVPASEPQ
jgi:hypothetical protein